MSHPANSARPGEGAVPDTEPVAAEPPAWEGDDDHVIFWMLSLTPTQRLEVAQAFVDSVRMLKNGLRS
jgi:hypothetical protein